MKLLVGDIVVNYQYAGKGKVILMLHGWGSDLSTFDQLANDLGKSYRVVRVDLPGFGGSESPPPSWDLANYVDFVAEFVKKLKLEPYYLLTHSLGGRIAIKGVGETKLKPARLILLSAHGIRESKKLRSRLLWLTAKVGKAATLPLPARYRRQLRQKLYSAAGSDDYLKAGSLRQIFIKIVNEDVRLEAAMINLPALLIYGEDDDVTPPRYGQTFHKLIHGSKLSLVPDAKHYVHLDQPQRVNKLVMDFLK